MADRVEVVDPASGATLTVSADSVQAKLWGAKVDEPEKRKPGRPKKSE